MIAKIIFIFVIQRIKDVFFQFFRFHPMGAEHRMRREKDMVEICYMWHITRLSVAYNPIIRIA